MAGAVKALVCNQEDHSSYLQMTPAAPGKKLCGMPVIPALVETGDSRGSWLVKLFLSARSVWVRPPASKDKVEEQWRKITDINLRPPHAHIHTNTPCAYEKKGTVCPNSPTTQKRQQRSLFCYGLGMREAHVLNKSALLTDAYNLSTWEKIRSSVT